MGGNVSGQNTYFELLEFDALCNQGAIMMTKAPLTIVTSKQTEILESVDMIGKTG